MAELTVAAGLARGLFDFAVAAGASGPELSARSGIGAAQLLDQDGRVPLSGYMALMRAGQVLCGDPALALHYGAAMDLAEISVVGLIGQACETMLEAFAQLNRYGRLVMEFDGPRERFRAVVRGDGIWLEDTRLKPEVFSELTESAFARMICGPRAFGVTQVARAVHVTHAAPAYRAEVERIYGAPVVFSAGWNAILIDERWMEHRIRVQPRFAFGILTRHADLLLQRLERADSVRARVQGLVAPVLHTGVADMAWVAGKMEMSRQTLFRKLKGEDCTFEELLGELRKDLAVQYLQAGRVSVNEIAYLLGFSDPAAFSRAFKRWMGVGPRAFRQSGL